MYAETSIPEISQDFEEPKKYIFEIKPQNRFKLSELFLDEFRGMQPHWGFGALSYITFKRSYARVVEGENRTEEFWETLQRVVQGTFSILKQRARSEHKPWDENEAQDKAQEMFKRMWTFKFLPPGRGLFAMGTEALQIKGSGILNNCAFISTKNISRDFSRPFTFLMDFLMLGAGVGFDVKGAGLVTIITPIFNPLKPFVVEDSREGWIEAVKVILEAYVGKGFLPSTFDYSKIRDVGVPLKTFGGTSSGYKPLQELLDSINKVLSKRIGQEITESDIVDICNYIGRAVVAGNVRRSSEIAIGNSNDEVFLSLKDPAKLIEIRQRQRAVAHTIHAWDELEGQLSDLRIEQSKYNTLDSEFAAWQQLIDQLEETQQSLCLKNEEWLSLEEESNKHPLTTHRWASNNTVFCEVGMDYKTLAKQTATNGEPGYFWIDIARKYGRLADPINNSDKGIEGINPCGEIGLESRFIKGVGESGELCNVVEVFPTHHETLDDFLITLKYAYLYAKVVTLVPTHDKGTNAIVSSNRRIGVSLAGIFEMYEKLGMVTCIRWWDTGYKYLRKLDKEYSFWLGISSSIKITTTKPGGSVPLVAGVEGGLKIPSAPFYFRTMRVASDSPLIHLLSKAGYRIEDDRTTPRTSVVYFPCKAPDGVRTAAKVSLWEQAMLLTAVQKFWSDNAVSATLMFQPKEAAQIEHVLSAYEGQWKSASFLPFSDHAYLQAPYQPCTEVQYVTAMHKIKDISTVEGNTHEVTAEDKYCSGDRCEIGVKT